jgi:polysaccharide pyruvyl transferase WcaK-like protein
MTDITEPLSRLDEYLAAGADDAVLLRQLREIIKNSSYTVPERAPGTPLRLLLAGYNGGGNTGADVRVAEMIRQLRAILGRENVQIGLIAAGETLPLELADEIRPELNGDYLPDFLERTCPRYDGVIACEGSMFKSNFSTSLAAFMAASLGIASASGRLAVGYGAEAGRMEPGIRQFVADLGQGPLVLCRNAESRTLLDGLGLRTGEGADTAWTYQALPEPQMRQRLRMLGVGQRPLLVICPVNPFWWPVRPDLAMAQALELLGTHRELHYASVLFHADSEEIRRSYAAYLNAIADAAAQWKRENQGSVLIIGMDRVDRQACRDLAARFDTPPPVVQSGDVSPAAIVGMLRAADLLLSSRFHAIVTSMQAGVPTVGISMDERINNLLGAGENDRRLLRADSPDLAAQVLPALRYAQAERESIGAAAQAFVAGQLRAMGEMGRRFADEVLRFYPDAKTPASNAGWDAYLPSMHPELHALLERNT